MTTTSRLAPGLLPGLVLAATLAHGADPAPLFSNDDFIEVVVDAPLTALMDERPDETELKGSFAWTEPDGTEKRVAVKLRTRGNYRRDRDPRMPRRSCLPNWLPTERTMDLA